MEADMQVKPVPNWEIGSTSGCGSFIVAAMSPQEAQQYLPLMKEPRSALSGRRPHRRRRTGRQQMRTAPAIEGREPPLGKSPSAPPVGLPRRIGAFLLKEFLEILPPTIFFFVGFNLIVLTTNLILANFGGQFGSFMIATASALIVAKALLVANALPIARRYDQAPLIRPILFKTVFYSVAVFIARLLEHWIEYLFSKEYVFGGFLRHEIASFSWDRFIAIQIWIVVLFLIYLTASELNHLFGEGELRHLLFTSRPAELPLDRRQRIRELIRLSKLADTHSVDEFRDPTTSAHAELVDIVRRLAAEPRQRERSAA
jgi:hypothetical protein